MAKGVLISMLVIAIGALWLLNTLHFIGGVDWMWSGLLALAGVIAQAWGKINKISFIVGSFLVIASIASVLRQTGIMTLDVEVPVLVIVFGIVLLIAQLPAIPLPQMIVDMKAESAKERASK